MGRRRSAGAKPEQSVVDSALASMSAEELRGIIHVILLELDDRAHGRVMSSIIDRAASRGSGCTPRGQSRDEVSEIVAFVEAARRVGYADPSEIDDCLRQGSNAFLAKDYPAAVQILRELLISIGDGEIDLGQHEMVDEVLGVDVAVCATQYVVSTYMTAAPADRAKVVRDAIEEMRGVGHFWEPLREMERVAVEPLVELDEFLQRWRGLIEENAKTERQSDWDTDTDRWLREVAQRMEGADGLARIARSTRRADDLRAWCRVLMESKSWKAALAACEEAAEIVADKVYWRGEFLDDAALAAQELRRKDLPARLERAWRQAPSTLRLFRWLGSARTERCASWRRCRRHSSGSTAPRVPSAPRWAGPSTPWCRSSPEPRWLAEGWGYEITSLDVHAAHDHAMQAAKALGCEQETRARILQIVEGDHSPGMFVRQVLGRRLGLSEGA